MSLFIELRRRNVFRIAGIYAVVGWVLMQVAGTLEASLNLPEWFDSVITAGLLIGYPIALLLSWVFEMTPEGVKRTEDLPNDTESPAAENNALEKTLKDKEIVDASIAVLPFADLSQAGDQEYFSDGISEEILNVLFALRV
ncbi:MAG: hypothetical protein ACI9IA_000568 [Enterobacterales bacterium]|jgi:hypothetical protein